MQELNKFIIFIFSFMDILEQFQYNIQFEGKLSKFQNDLSFINLSFTLQQKATEIVQTLNLNQHIIIVVDKSGSMSGSPIEASKQGIIEMVKFFHQKKLRNITLIEYQSNATIKQFDGMNLEAQIQIIKNIHGGGGTSFKSAFDSIVKSIHNKKSNDVKVIFFTDGQDYSAKNEVPNFKKNFIHLPNSEFHTIGFRENHDAILLNEITKVGGKQGTFQYCKSIQEIKNCVESVTGLVGCSSINANLIIEKQEIPLELDEAPQEEDSNKTSRYKTVIFLHNNKIKQGLVVKFISGNSQKFIEIPVKNLISNETASTSENFIKLIFIKTQIGLLLQKALNINKGAQIDKQLCQQLVQSVESYDKQLDILGEQGSKLKGKEKKEFFPQLFEVKQLVSEFYSKLKDLQSGQINNDKVAALNALAYRKITKKGLQKKLDVRTQNNIVVINSVYEKVKQLSEKINYKQLEEKYSDLSKKIGSCVYSASNFIEALKDQDCLCLTYDVSRSQAAIMDPSQIIIKDIFPTYITVSSFLFSAEYALKNNKEAHGGFDKKAQGSILKGIARQDITGVLPLYICPQNWQVAKQLMKPALGWTVTLDPLGYAFSQVKTVPFLVLSKLYNSNFLKKSEHTQFQIQLVQETCRQIILDASHEKADVKLSEQVIKCFNQYTNPISRTIDVIANNQVFIVQLYLLTKMKLLEIPQKQKLKTFFNYVMEEEMRRNTYGFNENIKINEKIFQLLNIDTQRYVNQPFQDYVEALNSNKDKNENENQYAFLFQTKLGAYQQNQVKSENKEEKEKVIESENKPNSKPVTGKIEYEINLRHNNQYNKGQKEAFEQLQKIRKKTLNVLILKNLFDLPVNFNQISVTPANEYFYFALYIQNKFHAKNSDRRDSITNKHYMDPFTSADLYIRNLYIKFAEEEKLKKINQYSAKITGNLFAQVAQDFYTAKSGDEAAGTLMDATLGKSLIYYYQALLTPGAPLFKEKLTMLVKGHYKGVKLYRDASEWHICRNKSNALIRNNFKQLIPEEWINSGLNLSKTYVGILEKQYA